MTSTISTTDTADRRKDRSVTRLDSGWLLHPLGEGSALLPERLDAQVPGCVHTDLLRAGAIADPYLDTNASGQAWLFDLDWRYVRDLADVEAPADGERVEIVFDGLDTFAEVSVDGRVVGSSANMHRALRVDVTDLLPARELRVDFASPTRIADAEAERQGHRPSAYPTPFNAVRKMAASFGWDWGPDLRTSGIWRPARVERWRHARLAEVVPRVRVEDGVGIVELTTALDWASEGDVTLTAEIAGRRAEVRVAHGQRRASLTVQVDDPALWWPVGYGDQPLWPLRVTLSDDDATLDAWERRVGFRTVEVDRSPDEFGTRFTLMVNGVPVFAKGVNWIPDDHFVSRIDADRYRRRLVQARDAHINLVRVWGGGIYEDDAFYQACDELGLLVWQDFLLACAAYDEAAPLRAEMEAEARENLARLVAHPSLAVLNGGNENVWGYEDWGWKELLDGRSWGGWYAAELFPAVAAELAPGVPYSVNSPYSPGASATGVHPNDPDHGTHHQWEVWNRIDYTHYRDDIPRFASEFGYQAPPAWRTLQDWLHVDGQPITSVPGAKETAVFLEHQKADGGNRKLDDGMAPHLGVPTDFADWHWATQLQQAHAVAYAVDHYRSHWPRTAGSIVWQLNDCWPVTSWAAIDYEERRKPLWYALRQAYAPRRLVVAKEADGWSVTAVNDTDQAWEDELRARRETFDGGLLAEDSAPVSVPARSVLRLPLSAPLVTPGDAEGEALVVGLGAERVVELFAEVKDARLSPDAVDVRVAETAKGYRIDVTARSLVKDLTVLADRVAADAVADDALVTLPAGASRSINVHTAERGVAEAFRVAPVLRTANDLSALARA